MVQRVRVSDPKAHNLVEPQIVDDGREIMTLRKERRLLKWAGENRLLIGIVRCVFELFQVKIADLGACSGSPENLCAPALYQGTVGVFDAGPDVVDIAAVVAVDQVRPNSPLVCHE